MKLKNNVNISNKNCSKEEKSKKNIITYIIVGVCCFLLNLLKVNFVVCILLSIVCGFCYFLFGPTPKIKPKKAKKEKKRSSLDEEYLKEFEESFERSEEELENPSECSEEEFEETHKE